MREQAIRTQGQDSGEQLASFFLTANVNDLSKGSKVHPRMEEEDEN